MGHVRQRTKDSWQAAYPDPVRGGTNKIYKTFSRKQGGYKAAKRWLIEQEATVHDGTHIDPRKTDRPFHELAAMWKETWAGRIEPNTMYGYEYALSKYVLPEFGRQRIGAITHESVQRYVNRLTAEGRLAPASIRGIYGTLRAAMNCGVRLGVVKVNPCNMILLPRIPHHEMLYLTAEEVGIVAEAIEPHFRVLVYTAAYTGLRAGELYGLHRADVDLQRGVLQVRRALKETNGTLHFGPTKTHACRTITLPRFLRSMLEEHLRTTVGKAADALVFTTLTGQPMRHNLFYRRYFKPTVRAVLPAEKHALRWHDLRHTCASLLIAAGAHPKAIQVRLGHKTIQLTMDRYGHLLPSLEAALADVLDATFHAGAGSPPGGELATAVGQ